MLEGTGLRLFMTPNEQKFKLDGNQLVAGQNFNQEIFKITVNPYLQMTLSYQVTTKGVTRKGEVTKQLIP